MSATVDVAIRFGYLANGYHGVQIQPDVRTVQAELGAPCDAAPGSGVTSTSHCQVARMLASEW